MIMGAPMPRKYVAAMVMDRISASRNYLGDAYTIHLEYYLNEKQEGQPVVPSIPRPKKELQVLNPDWKKTICLKQEPKSRIKY